MTDHHELRPLIALLDVEREDEDWDRLILKAMDRAATALEMDADQLAEYAWVIAGSIDAYQRRADDLARAVARWRARDVANRGSVRFADTYVTVGETKPSRQVDTTGLLPWLEHSAATLGEPELVSRIWRLDGSNIRITALRSLADRVYRASHDDATDEDVERYVKLIEDTFVTQPDGDGVAKLKEIPVSRAAKWVSSLRHGQRVGRFDNKAPSLRSVPDAD